MTATYWTPVSTALLDDNPVWEDAGLELLTRSPLPIGGSVVQVQFRDPAAPPQLEGRHVEPVLSRVGGRPVITGYNLLADDGHVLRRYLPLSRR
jgi:hypothetical protein